MANSNMDPFDEFEFKPLTDGLGFHKKSVSLKEGLKESGVLQDELQTIPTSVPRGLLEDIPKAPGKKHSFEDVLSALEKTPIGKNQNGGELTFTEPLPREPKSQSPFPAPSAFKGPIPGTPVVPPPAQIKKVPAQTQLNSVGTRRGAADSPQRKQLMPATMSVPAAILDLMIVIALALVFLVALLTVTKVDLNAVISTLQRDYMTQISLGVLFLAVMQMYVITARSFFGATLGEWTFDLQIGQDEEIKQESYPVKIAFRSLLNIITGIVLLPLVSALIGRDIAGQLSGVKLYRQRV